MTGLLVITHLLAAAVGAVCAGAYAGFKVRQRETDAELRGMLSTVIAHSPEDITRRAGC